jgi:hypothetical protein
MKNRISKVAEPAGAAPQLKPPANQKMLIFSARRLLTEKCSITVSSFRLDEQPVAIMIQARMETGLMNGVSGYSHYGIND